MKSIFVLATPFALYGMAFFLLGMAPYVASSPGRGWVYNVATALYAIASASGSFFFALNFGDEGLSFASFHASNNANYIKGGPLSPLGCSEPVSFKELSRYTSHFYGTGDLP